MDGSATVSDSFDAAAIISVLLSTGTCHVSDRDYSRPLASCYSNGHLPWVWRLNVQGRFEAIIAFICDDPAAIR